MLSFAYVAHGATAWLPDHPRIGCAVPGVLSQQEARGIERIVLTDDGCEHAAIVPPNPLGAHVLPLFVYGTLMEGEAEHARVHKVGAARAARITGRLFALPAGYPGAIAGEGSIEGQLFDVAGGWEELDEYEG